MTTDKRRGFLSLCLGTATTQLGFALLPENKNAILFMKNHQADKPAIARIWRGRVKRERADEYQRYNYEAGIKPLMEKAMGVQALREDRATETEFITISYWESIEAMSRFTGGDPTRIHHLDRDPEFLIEMPRQVQILTIYESHGRIG